MSEMVDLKEAVADLVSDGDTVSLEGFDTATREYRWSPDDVENWWLSTLVQLLLR